MFKLIILVALAITASAAPVSLRDDQAFNTLEGRAPVCPQGQTAQGNHCVNVQTSNDKCFFGLVTCFGVTSNKAYEPPQPQPQPAGGAQPQPQPVAQELNAGNRIDSPFGPPGNGRPITATSSTGSRVITTLGRLAANSPEIAENFIIPKA